MTDATVSSWEEFVNALRSSYSTINFRQDTDNKVIDMNGIILTEGFKSDGDTERVINGNGWTIKNLYIPETLDNLVEFRRKTILKSLNFQNINCHARKFFYFTNNLSELQNCSFSGIFRDTFLSTSQKTILTQCSMNFGCPEDIKKDSILFYSSGSSTYSVSFCDINLDYTNDKDHFNIGKITGTSCIFTGAIPPSFFKDSLSSNSFDNCIFDCNFKIKNVNDTLYQPIIKSLCLYNSDKWTDYQQIEKNKDLLVGVTTANLINVQHLQSLGFPVVAEDE